MKIKYSYLDIAISALCLVAQGNQPNVYTFPVFCCVFSLNKENIPASGDIDLFTGTKLIF